MQHPHLVPAVAPFAKHQDKGLDDASGAVAAVAADAPQHHAQTGSGGPAFVGAADAVGEATLILDLTGSVVLICHGGFLPLQ